MISRHRSDIIGRLHLINVMLHPHVIPCLLIVGFQLRVILHIFPALHGEWGTHLITLVIDQFFLIFIILYMEVSVVAPRIADIETNDSLDRFKDSLLLTPFPVGTWPDAGNVLHIGIECQARCFLAAVDLLDLLLIKGHFRIAEIALETKCFSILETACRIVQHFQLQHWCIVRKQIQRNLRISFQLESNQIAQGTRGVFAITVFTVQCWYIFYVSAVLRPQVPTLYRFAVENVAEIIALCRNRLVTHMSFAVFLHKIAVLVHVTVQLRHRKSRICFLCFSQIGGAVAVEVYAGDKESRRNDQQQDIEQRLPTPLQLLNKHILIHLYLSFTYKNSIIFYLVTL